jgi:hypothetical protein
VCDYKVNVCVCVCLKDMYVLVIKTSGFVKKTCGEMDFCVCIAKRCFDKSVCVCVCVCVGRDVSE